MERYGETDVQEGNESVKASDSGLTPPNTVLVRWMDELLLLDAWNIRGVSSTADGILVNHHCYTLRERKKALSKESNGV